MTDIDNALVMVTGASGGFGAHLVEQLLAAGSRLIVTDQDDERLDGLRSRIADTDRIVAAIAADLGSADESRQLCRRIIELGCVPDVLINNAGIAIAGRPDHVPADRWEAVLDVNLFAPIRLTTEFLPHMIARGSGHVVNTSSLAGWVGSPYLSAYCASKFGLRGFGEALRLDLREHGIRVSTVYPSFSRTPILQSEQFGLDRRREVPEEMQSDPAVVVANILAGIRRNRADIFPDRTARFVHYLVRFVPAAIPLLQRRLDRMTRRQ